MQRIFSGKRDAIREVCLSPLTWPLLMLLAASLAVACGTPAGASGESDTGVDDTGAVDTGKDVKVQDKGEGDDSQADAGSDTGVPADADDAVDTTDVQSGDVSVDPTLCTPAAPGFQPGDCGSPCTSSKSCTFPYCIATPDNSVCTKDCGGDDPACPSGWKCKQLADFPDPQFGCVPASPNIGKPCLSDNDCRTEIGLATGGGDDYCVSFGDAGAFCGGGCDQGESCPTHFTCQQVKSISGKLVQQCVTDKAQLDLNCTKRYEVEGDETICYNTQGKDKCAGRRHCDSGKLTACDAATPAAETCNGIDDNCNGLTDEPVPGATCNVTSANGKLKCPGKPLCAGGIESCVGQMPKAETCNGQDDDCSGQTDEGCDDDGDGYCDAAMGFEPGAPVCAKGGGDCDDLKDAVHPKASEVCDGADNDCNGFSDGLDPGLTLSDGQPCENQLGVCAGSQKGNALCQGGIWQACSPTDYKKYDSNYSNTEICDDKDNNCNGKTDEGCDDDQDGYCDVMLATLGFPLSCPKGGGDCDDSNSKARPGASELCDDLDENCNGVIDEGCDKDKDGWCDAAMNTFGAPKACSKGGGDCNDSDGAIRPDAAEKCNNVDDDCNDAVDEMWPDLGLACAGGKGQCAVKGTKVCKADGTGSTCSVQPGLPQTEVCDNLDNNCNGGTDEGCDDDLDGYCDAEMGTIGHPNACLAGSGDCDDTDTDVHPGAKELCDAKDNDCDAKTDADDGDILNDDPQICENQKGACAGAKKYATMCKNGLWAKCDAPQYKGWNLFYSTVENCDNIDNDCNGGTDEGCDEDKDGYCAITKKIVGAPDICTAYDSNGQAITHINDCDDSNAANFPGNVEWCDNQDNNCNNKPDEGCDKDFDGYCDAALITIGKPSVCTSGGGDCNDDPKANGILINPGQPDSCFDSIDQNCSGTTDENCPWYFDTVDQKGPDYSAEGFYQCAGYLDIPNSNDIPDAGWANACSNPQWKRIRIACGQPPAAGGSGSAWPLLRSVDLISNVFLPTAIGNGTAKGLIGAVHGFTISDAAALLQSNLLVMFQGNGDYNSYPFDHTYSWLGDQYGYAEDHWNLIINNPGSPWEAANCFGLGLWDNYATPNLTHQRALLVYVGRCRWRLPCRPNVTANRCRRLDGEAPAGIGFRPGLWLARFDRELAPRSEIPNNTGFF